MKAGQPIGDDPSACTEVELRPGGDFGETEALDDGELHAQRVSLLVGLDGGDKGRLAGRATTAFAPASLATEIGIVELDRPAERVRLAGAVHGAARPGAAKPVPATTSRLSPAGRGRSPSRQGKRGILIHVDPELARQLKHLAVERDTSLQALGVEALQRLLAGK